MDNIKIRALRDDDGEAAGIIFFDAVHQGAAAHYTRAQRIAWAGEHPNPLGWRTRLVGVEGFVAKIAGALVGFMTIDAKGYIDLAFVRPEVAGSGVGWRLYEAVEARAQELGALRLTTEASKTAKPFFERQGWRVDQEQVVMKRDVPLTNFKMSKALAPASSVASLGADRGAIARPSSRDDAAQHRPSALMRPRGGAVCLALHWCIRRQ